MGQFQSFGLDVEDYGNGSERRGNGNGCGCCCRRCCCGCGCGNNRGGDERGGRGEDRDGRGEDRGGRGEDRGGHGCGCDNGNDRGRTVPELAQDLYYTVRDLCSRSC